MPYLLSKSRYEVVVEVHAQPLGLGRGCAGMEALKRQAQADKGVKTACAMGLDALECVSRIREILDWSERKRKPEVQVRIQVRS